MDAIYRGQRHIYDLTRKYYLLGRDELIDALVPPPGGTVLEIGCGTGRNLIAAARAWPEARFFGIDISEAMLETARTNIARAGMSARIMVAAGDATHFNAAALFGMPAFDRVFLSYTLSMIPDWRGALVEAAGKLGPGGRLEVVDFGQQERLPRWWRALLFAWLRRFHVSPRGQLFEVVEGLRSPTLPIARTVPRFRGYAWRANLARG
jgi:S-adenosylmethionine-diacylgycerolhomoserine-N-methlytransferase